MEKQQEKDDILFHILNQDQENKKECLLVESCLIDKCFSTIILLLKLLLCISFGSNDFSL